MYRGGGGHLMASANLTRWTKAQLTRNAAPVAKRLVANKARYMAVAAQTGVPWFIIAVIHQRESSGSFSGVLHNGERIIGTGRRTTLVPKGRGPFSAWEEAAIDALTNCAPFLARRKDWSLSATLDALEEYNGLGYRTRGLPSPYVWAGTDQYVRGKYVADGKFDPNHVDQQFGCAALLIAMMAADHTITFTGATIKPPVPKTGTKPTTKQDGAVATTTAAAASWAWWEYGLAGLLVAAAIGLAVFLALKFFRK